MVDPTFDEQISGIAALEHPISQQIYRLVVEQDWVTRDAAAATLNIARSVAAFHLDKLLEAGLLTARFERTSGRTGPGAGRPAKFYGRSGREIELSIPPRHYDLAGSMLADAITRASAHSIALDDAVAQAAHETGVRVGADRVAVPASERDDELMKVLAEQGYEPRQLGPTIAMVNCPFHALAEHHRDLVCHMNLDFLAGVLEGTGNADVLTGRLAPEPGYCCVRIDQRGAD